MRVVLDASRLEEKGEAHLYLQESLNFPEYYGKNLDALSDCLMELTDTVIAFENQEQAGGYFKKVYRVFCHAAEENPGLVLEKWE